jgi:hypothetical protein
MGITHDEFLELFAPPEHWELLKTAGEIAQVSNAGGGRHSGHLRHDGVAGGTASITFAMNGDGPLLPRNDVVLKKAPKELVERVTSWVNREIEVAMDFALAKVLLDWFNAHFETKGQIRFVWPSLVSLCSLSESTAELGERLREFKTVRAFPAMPLEVRAACKKTSGIITSAMLIEETPDTFTAPVRLSLAGCGLVVDGGALGQITL